MIVGPSARRRTVLGAASWAVGGLLFGVASKWSDLAGPAWLADSTSARAIWVAVVFGIGWWAPSRFAAGLHAAAFFAALVVGYSGFASAFLGYPLAMRDIGWFLVALIACPLLAALVHLAAPRAVLGALVAGVAAALALADGDAHRLFLTVTRQSGPNPTRVGAGVVAVAVAVAMALVPRTPRRIAVAVATALVATPVLVGTFDALQSALKLG